MTRAKAVDPKWRRRELCKYAIALSDIHLATEICDLMLEEQPGLADPHYGAYHTAIVNAYARPFTENKPLGRIAPSVRKILSADERELHDELLVERHTAAAHSDLTARPVYRVPRGAKMFETGKRSEGGGFATGRIAWGFDRWARVKALTMTMGSHVQGEAFRLLDVVYGDLYVSEPIEISID